MSRTKLNLKIIIKNISAFVLSPYYSLLNKKLIFLLFNPINKFKYNLFSKVRIFSKIRLLSIISFLIVALNNKISYANDSFDEKAPFGRYSKQEINDARFRTGTIQQLLEKSRLMPQKLNDIIIGQNLAVQVLSDRISQYLEGFPNRTREPISLNLVGLPGVGKSALIDEVKKLGFQVVQLDVQNFMSNPDTFVQTIERKLRSYISSGTPVILALEEIDKAPELGDNNKEVSAKIIGAINQALTEGKIQGGLGVELSVSNVMIITTMNFSPADIESFAQEILKQEKSFYDFTVEDFQAFDLWIRKQPSAKYKVLAKLFRSNTISRLAPQTLILSPFTNETYNKLTSVYAQRTIEQNLNTKGNDKKMALVDIDSSLIHFLTQETAFAPSGARETVSRVNALVEQLLSFALKVDGGDVQSLSRPRSITLGFNPELQEAFIRVTPFTYSAGKSYKGNTFESHCSFNEMTRLFDSPKDMVIQKPQLKDHLVNNTITKKQVFNSRFPMVSIAEKEKTLSVATQANKQLIGQENAIATIEEDFNRYMTRQGPSQKEPSSRALIGFPGIGKSESFNLSAAALGIPVIRLNMQQFSSDSPDTIIQFLSVIQTETNKVRSKKSNQKYILLIEELDKVFEINPQNGSIVNRPIMAIIKDIINDGQAKIRSTSGSDFTIDVRDAFIGITMNFSIDRFGFKADPRLTSIDDVISAWKKIKSTTADLKSILGTMFLPETVSRIISRMHVMKPLNKKEYQSLIDLQLAKVIRARLVDADGVNRSQIDVSLSSKYRELLFSETVIPSEGARNTVVASQNMIGVDLEFAIQNLPKYASYSKNPITIVLDYDPLRQVVISKVLPQANSENNEKIKTFKIAEKPIALQFPPLSISGKIPQDRLKAASHEFGHAFIAALLGYRFEYISAVSPKVGYGGYVKFQKTNGQSAYALMADIYSCLASRALERIVLSPNPLANDSVLDITSGASQDILQATRGLFYMIYKFGMDPNGGTIERAGFEGASKYANFSDLPKSEIDRLAQILRKMENFIVTDILNKYSKQWLANKISVLAQVGGMNEEEFYQLTELQFPAGTGLGVVNSHFQEMFAESIVPVENSQKAILENAQNYNKVFIEALNENINTKTSKIKRPLLINKCSKVFL